MRPVGLGGSISTRVAVGIGGLCLATTTALSNWNVAREEGKDAAIRGNIDTILTQARYGVEERKGTSADCRDGLFNEANIAAALDAIRVANNGGTITCSAAGDQYAVSATRPVLGFFKPATTYWCGSATQNVCGTDTLPSGLTCGCAAP